MRIPLLHSRGFTYPFVIAVALFDALMTKLGSPFGNVAAATLFFAYGIYCTQNFLACREVHCVITGPGYLIASLLMVLQIAGIHVGGVAVPWLVFVAVTIIGHALEGVYASRFGRHFLER